jgi:hypothetical protein
LFVLAIFIAGGYFLFEYIANLFSTLEPQLKTVTIIATIVAFFCAAIIASGLKTNSPSSVCVERATLYQQLLAFWSERAKGATAAEGRATESNLIGLEQQLALHGSSRVIAAHMNLRKSAEQGDDSQELLKKLLQEMRADIGRSELNLNKNAALDLLLGRH